MKKQKLLCLFLCILLVFVGCGKKEDNTTNPDENQVEQGVTDEAQDSIGTDKTENTADAPVEKIDMNIGALKGPTAIGMVKLMQDASEQTTTNNYNFQIAGTADELSAALIKGDLDIAAIPCNLASVLYQKTNHNLVVAGINTLGVLYIVETGDSIRTVEDLKGKTIYSTGFGTTPQYTLNYLLTSHGLDPEKDVTIEYKTEATEVAAALSEATNAVAMLPQPYVTTVMMNNDKVRIALDITKEWEAASDDGSTVVTGVVVVRKDFLEQNKEAVNVFLTEYQNSVTYVQENVEDAANLVESFDIFKAAVAVKAIPYCNIVFITGEEMEQKVTSYLTTLYEQKPESVGGTLPDNEFYYKCE